MGQQTGRLVIAGLFVGVIAAVLLLTASAADRRTARNTSKEQS